MDAFNLLSFLTFYLLSVIPRATPNSSGFYLDTESQTVLVEKLDNVQKGYIKDEMLDILGIHMVPRPHMHHQKSATQYMTDLYNEFSQHDEEDENYNGADLVISFVNNENSLSSNHMRTFHFDFSDVPKVETVENAHLRIYKRANEFSSRVHQSLTISIFRLIERDQFGEIMMQLESSNSSISTGYDGWVLFNVSSAVASWTYFPTTNLGLYVEVTNDLGEMIDPKSVGLMTSDDSEDDLQPFLVAYFKTLPQYQGRSRRDTAPRRLPRSSGRLNENHIQKDYFKWMRPEPCQRRSMLVNFEDLGWKEWIIAPSSYSAFYCTGECKFPLASHMNASNHAIVQTLVHLFKDDVPTPGCAPIRLSHVSVLFFDDFKNVRLWEYKNMVVKSCGCL